MSILKMLGSPVSHQLVVNNITHSMMIENLHHIIYIIQPVLHKVTLDLLEVLVNLKAEWNSATIDSGAQFVMMPGELLMLQ